MEKKKRKKEGDGYISLFPRLHTPFPLSLISLVVSVDIKHHVYLKEGENNCTHI